MVKKLTPFDLDSKRKDGRINFYAFVWFPKRSQDPLIWDEMENPYPYG
jgi:hypothetical protein